MSLFRLFRLALKKTAKKWLHEILEDGSVRKKINRKSKSCFEPHHNIYDEA